MLATALIKVDTDLLEDPLVHLISCRTESPLFAFCRQMVAVVKNA